MQKYMVKFLNGKHALQTKYAEPVALKITW